MSDGIAPIRSKEEQIATENEYTQIMDPIELKQGDEYKLMNWSNSLNNFETRKVKMITNFNNNIQVLVVDYKKFNKNESDIGTIVKADIGIVKNVGQGAIAIGNRIANQVNPNNGQVVSTPDTTVTTQEDCTTRECKLQRMKSRMSEQKSHQLNIHQQQESIVKEMFDENTGYITIPIEKFNKDKFDDKNKTQHDKYSFFKRKSTIGNMAAIFSSHLISGGRKKKSSYKNKKTRRKRKKNKSVKRLGRK